MHDYTRRTNIDLDPSAQDYIGTIIGTTAERIERERRLQDPAAALEAERALFLLIRRAAAESLAGTTEKRSRGGSGITLTSASVDRSLAGICPMWPIC